jgi:hypothetical protein
MTGDARAELRLVMLAGAAVLILLAAAAGVWACAHLTPTHGFSVAARNAPVDPATLIERLASEMSAAGPYRDPTREERSQAARAARSLLGDPNETSAPGSAFGALGFTAHHGTDPVTGRPFSLYIAEGHDERAWGAVLVDRSTRPRLVVGVPHPVFDIDTEKLGIAIHRHVPGSVLLVAGAHRGAADGRADVAHNPRSVFHIVATEFARRQVPQVQVHGFADDTAPDTEVIVSTGAAPTTGAARDVATALRRAGLVTCRAWTQPCGPLEGTTNDQGRAAQDLDAPFIHVELASSLRRDPAQRELVAAAIGQVFSG